jgi:hypothetical protein
VKQLNDPGKQTATLTDEGHLKIWQETFGQLPLNCEIELLQIGNVNNETRAHQTDTASNANPHKKISFFLNTHPSKIYCCCARSIFCFAATVQIQRRGKNKKRRFINAWLRISKDFL